MSRLLFNKIKILKFARGIIGNKKKIRRAKMFEWKHPNYYKELRKLREEAEKELEKEEQEEEDTKED